MESVLSEPYHNHYGSLVFTTHSAALDQQDNAFLTRRPFDIYNLRPRTIQAMSKQKTSQTVTTTMTSSSPKRIHTKLSRSRTAYDKRLIVNARERERMKNLNKAYDNLRNALPCYIADGHISKITTLRLAINYIKTLTEVLKETKSEELASERPAQDEFARIQNMKVEVLMNTYQNSSPIKVDYGLPFRASSNAVTGDGKPCHTSSEIDTSVSNNRDLPTVFEKNNFLK